jgi:hypothetical protein
MQILTMPAQWPVLPMTEIVLIGDDTAEKSLAQPLVTFLLEGLRTSSVI